MKNLAFWRGTAVALGLSLIGSICFSLLTPLFGSGLTARIVLASLSFLYLASLYGLSGRFASRGLVVGMASWSAVIAFLAVFNPSLSVWLATLVGLLWIIRCLLSYGRPLSALADTLINGVALLCTLLTALHTHSVFLSLWAFFAVLAAVALLPGYRPAPGSPKDQNKDRFEQSYQTAQAALRRLAAKR